eukprot:TRINITY_DN37282_c0_g1_i2.p1 TRINITY_DN37282_c0_g1~~TRINITY_DN37282_c0_g1_i2.p1  ORF type:complete len:207 (+),score=20.04 TRINITY_DN37282_c0_g1_i2:122-742(+)
MAATLRSVIRLSSAVALVALLLCASTATSSAARLLAAKPQQPAKPTDAQIKAEVQNAARNITAKFPSYSKFAAVMKQSVNLKGYNVSALRDATILAPNNDAMTALMQKIPMTQANLPKAYNITAFHVITKKYALPALKAAPAKAFPTMLRQPNWKQTGANAATVSFGVKNAPAANQTTVQTAAIYVGPYFIIHGVDRYLVPAGTVV